MSTIAGLTLVAAGMSPVSAQPEAPSDEGGALTQEFDPASAAPASTDWEGVESDTGLWIVRLAGPSVSAYQASLSAQDGEASAAELEAFDAELADEHAALEQSIDSTLGRDVPVEFTYRNVLNGMAVEVSAAEAEELRSLPGVLEVYPDIEREMETDVSHEVISSPSIWEGETAEGMATRGEGVVVGVIDSGINPFHPSFAETDGTGYTHTNPYGSGNYVGVCAEGAADYEDICNDKLIGAYNLNAASPDAQDRDNHGSHTASTAAGGVHTADAEIGGTVFEREVQGVAPQANVISYLVCYPGCPGASSIAAVDQAIDDGVDVLNYSISGSDLPWNDPVDLAFRDAAAAGINVVASGGNDGPGASTVAKTGPWMASTAATTHSRIFAKEISVDAPTPVPEELASIAGFPGDGPSPEEDVTAEVRSAEEVDPGNFRACSALPEDSMDGAIAFVERGDCTFPEKVQSAEDAGAVAVIIGNNFGGPPSAPGGLEVSGIPAVMIAQSSSQALVDFFAGTDETVTATWAAETSVAIDESWVDVMAGFSSRGPSQYDMVAPTYGAPGVNILAAGAAEGEDADQYAVLAGTSMSSPHAAGATALMRALHPDWTPTEIRSALASSADVDGLVKEDGVTAVDPFDIGSGRLNLSEAGRAGLVLDESIDAMIAADPAVGGDPATLNLPAMVDQECAGSCSWERTVTNVVDGSATWTASVDSPDGMEITASPAEVTLAAGESATVTITATVTGAVEEDWAFGRVTMNTDATHAGGAAVANTEMPVAVVPTAAVADVTVDPDEITSTQAPDETTTQTLTVGNAGGATLEWEFADAAEGVVSEQLEGGTSGIVSDYGNNEETGVYAAEDFTVADGASLTEIYIPGFWNPPSSLADATEISWRIYADEDGAPASSPEDGDDALWSFDAAPTAAGVDITDNNITLDVVEATGVAGELPAGTYWLSVFPSINNPPTSVDRWNWYQGADGSGAEAHLIDPSNLFGGGTEWTPLGDLVTFDALAYTLTGDVSCGADWVTLDPTSGATAPGEGTEVAVSLDSTGVEEGTYTTQVCLSSNDPDEPLVTVPVTMTVEEPELFPVIGVTPESVESEQIADVTTEQTVTITNNGDSDLDWELSEAESAPADNSGVSSEVSLPQGSDRSAGTTDVEGDPAPQAVQPAEVPMAATDLTEGFEDIEALPGEGWAYINNSEPLGTTSWFQGNPETTFPAQDGPDDSYVGANFNNSASPGEISNWMLTPEVDLTEGSTLSFWTRASGDGLYADRLEVRMSTAGDSTDVGTGVEGVGDFDTTLEVINEDLAPDGYPGEWTQYEVTIEGVDDDTTGRLAMRYTVPDAGPLGANSDYIGIDTLQYVAADVEPNACEIGTDIPWMSATPTSGTTEPGESSDVTVTVDSSGLEVGTYTGDLCVASNDPVTPLVLVPVSLEVVETPEEPLEVVRWSGDDRYKTAVEISSTYEPGVDVAFVATGLEFPDALAGSAVAGAWDAPVLLTRPGALPGATVNELARLQPESVVVLGGTTAVSDAVMEQIADVTGAPVDRWSGTDRYRTAAAVSEAYDSAERVFVATGLDYPDALAAAARAGAVDAPVLLVRTDGIPGATAAALDRLDPERITVLGGDAAVNDPVVQDLRDWAPTTRVAGLNRYVTAAKLMEEYVSAETVYIASGMDWPDALAGSAKAGTDEAPLLLTRPNGIPQVLATALQRLYPDRIVILGGTEAVSEGVEDDLGDLREWE
ncbi:cell wall-binding repeat-containing protein [Serinicoccus sp. LYQ131]|uniref:cell wall-binding repeat-containing protein n=1 Tax=Serinicoccus sp. LYQ131 TaxID=3378797 RepID=UPI0038524B67